MKRCNKCGLTKSRADFHQRSAAPDGLQANCKSCKAERDRERYAEGDTDHHKLLRIAGRHRRRDAARAFVIDFLEMHPCTDCGTDEILVLEFDHVCGAKKGNVSYMVCNGVALDRIIAEIDKCEVVCANCHRRRTAKRGNFYRVVA